MNKVTLRDFRVFKSPAHESSFYKGIPISLLEDFRQAAKDADFRFRIRYRGPRSPLNLSGYNRDRAMGRLNCTRQSSCLRSTATTFAVYRPDRAWVFE